MAVLRVIGIEEDIEEGIEEYSVWPSWLRRGKLRMPKQLVAVTVQAIIGVVLATVAIACSRSPDYVVSPWVIPTVFLTYLLGKSSSVTE